MPAGLAPISVASIIIGFISFVFTLSIFLNSFSSAWDTVLSAPNQIRDFLGNLREELYEEKEALKRARARSHGHSLKVFDESLKDLLKEFRRLERPFLQPGMKGRKVNHLARAEKGTEGEEIDEDFRPKAEGFYQCDWSHRVLWLQIKPSVVRLASILDRIQTRRIEREVSDVYMTVSSIARTLRGLDDRLWGIEDRLRISNVSVAGGGGSVGGRRGGGPSRHGERL